MDGDAGERRKAEVAGSRWVVDSAVISGCEWKNSRWMCRCSGDGSVWNKEAWYRKFELLGQN